jgi:uncharacterized heparinase superfamily protein
VLIGRIHKFAILFHKARGRTVFYLLWKAFDLVKKRVRKYIYRLPQIAISPDKFRRLLLLPSPTSLRDYFSKRATFSFFFSQAEVPNILSRLANHQSDYVSRLVDKAERISRHRLHVLATGELELGERIDWLKDYHSGLRWSQAYVFDIDFLDLERPSDVRIVWELNRLHFLVDLGKTYRATGNEKYVQKLIDLVSDWDRANPYAHTVNWACAMEPAIRAVNLIWAFMLILPSHLLDDDFVSRYLSLLLRHGRFIRQNLEYSDIRANHYLADLVALVYLALFLRELDAPQEWLRFALPRLDSEMTHQVYADGVDHEGSIPYHRLATELFLSGARLLHLNGIVLSRQFYVRLEKMLEFVQSYVKPDGLCPMFGDSDDGRLHILGEQHTNDHRYLLAVGAVIFKRADFKASAGQFWEEAAWLTGSHGWQEYDRLQPIVLTSTSRAFCEGGYFFLRHGDDYACVDCGDVGLRGHGGHGHCDILSFEATLCGTNIIIDRGCYLYTASRSGRRHVITAHSHNTLILDNTDYAQLMDYDIASVENTPGKLLQWIASDSGSLFEGEQYGYVGTRINVVHRRKIQLDGKNHRLTIVDRLIGKGNHHISARFYLAPHCDARSNGATCTIQAGTHCLFVFQADGPVAGRWLVRPTTFFPTYGVTKSTSMLEWQTELTLPAALHFCLQASSPSVAISGSHNENS